jgi:hypothetical protein
MSRKVDSDSEAELDTPLGTKGYRHDPFKMSLDDQIKLDLNTDRSIYIV